MKPFTPENGFEALENINSPKVVLNKNMNALYFSRSIIPYQRNAEKQDWLKNHTYYKHIGLYAYRYFVAAIFAGTGRIAGTTSLAGEWLYH